ncbi:MAG: hypothetical protein HUK21_01775 [Fibrobacteraceae bacterium]|mgnify:CR=1 FL=1|nr:hypothetical protein [Fibrobacteraceae bacterium]
MNTNFFNIVEKASAEKQSFDNSVKGVKWELNRSIKESVHSTEVVETKSVNGFAKDFGVRTGWLRGSLSYPWILVCIVIPAVLEMIV